MRAAITFRNPAKLAPYEAALRAVGFEPVRVPAGTAGSVEALDALLLTGGTDINPARYGRPPAPETEPPDDERDVLETKLLREAFDLGLPVLAICRGMQLFNVVHGGTLIQHLKPEGPHRLKQPDAIAHMVRVTKGTRLASILQEPEHAVNSRHHQAADRAGEGLIVSAISPDGVIEALERPDEPFAVAVQWHPEDRIQLSAGDRRLFEAFASAARERVSRGSPVAGAHP